MDFVHVKVKAANGDTGNQLRVLIDGIPKKIIWDELRMMYKNGKLTLHQMRSIGKLRKDMIKHVLGDKMGSPCYRNTGNDSPVSDFDFNYATFNTPNDTMSTLLNFYNDFYATFGEMPDITFDTNFYFCTTYLMNGCYKEIVNPKVLRLFRDINGIKHLYYNNDEWREVDQMITFLVYNDSNKDKFCTMLKTGKLFYSIINTISTEEDRDDFNSIIALLRVLVSINASCSIDAYISDITVGKVVYGLPYEDDKDMLMGYLDNFAFIKEWYHHHRGAENEFINFIEIVSKYIIRCYESIEGSTMRDFISNDLYRICKEWKEDVRGRLNINTYQTGDSNVDIASRNLIQRLNEAGFTTIDDIYGVMFMVYDRIVKNVKDIPEDVINAYQSVKDLIGTIDVKVGANGVNSDLNVDTTQRTYDAFINSIDILSRCV